MHKIVELEGIYLATLPTIELDAKLTHSVAQIASVRDVGPFSNEALDPFGNVRHCLIHLSAAIDD
jgi:hypothetical protein